MKFGRDKNVLENLAKCLQKVPFSKVPKSLRSPILFAFKEVQIAWKMTLNLKLFWHFENSMIYNALQLMHGVFTLFSSMAKVHFSVGWAQLWSWMLLNLRKMLKQSDCKFKLTWKWLKVDPSYKPVWLEVELMFIFYIYIKKTLLVKLQWRSR